jgi:hypothetical protein
LERVEEATIFFFSVYCIFSFGTIPFIHGWAWVIVLVTSFWAWMLVPLLIEKQEENEK